MKATEQVGFEQRYRQYPDAAAGVDSASLSACATAVVARAAATTVDSGETFPSSATPYPKNSAKAFVLLDGCATCLSCDCSEYR